MSPLAMPRAHVGLEIVYRARRERGEGYGDVGYWDAWLHDGKRSLRLPGGWRPDELASWLARIAEVAGFPARPTEHAPDETPVNDYLRKAIARTAREHGVEPALLRDEIRPIFGVEEAAALSAFQAEKVIEVLVPAMAGVGPPAPERPAAIVGHYYTHFNYRHVFSRGDRHVGLLSHWGAAESEAWGESLAAITGLPRQPLDDVEGACCPLVSFQERCELNDRLRREGMGAKK